MTSTDHKRRLEKSECTRSWAKSSAATNPATGRRTYRGPVVSVASEPTQELYLLRALVGSVRVRRDYNSVRRTEDPRIPIWTSVGPIFWGANHHELMAEWG